MMDKLTIVKPLTRRSLLTNSGLMVSGACLPSALRGQVSPAVGGPVAPVSPTPYPQLAKNPYPYTGVSGAGYPVDAASSRGGWRSGSSGLAYQGEHPYPFPTLPWDNYATGSAVKTGILPAIKPLIEVQVRDTIVCRGGD